MDMWRTRLREDHGVVAVVVAILMIVFVGFAALAVDMGYLYTVKRQLQASADAAALAGVRELLVGASESEVLEVAEEYALLNAVNPGDGLLMVPANGRATEEGVLLTEVGPNFVRVTVEKESPLFFGRIFSPDDPTIMASAEAQVAYVTGMRNLVPLGLPILRAKEVYAWVDGAQNAGAWLTKSEAGLWEGSLPIPALGANTSRKINLDVYNSQDFKEVFSAVAIVHALDPALTYDSVMSNVSVVVNYPGSGASPSTLSVAVDAEGVTTVELAGDQNKDAQKLTGTGQYAASFSAPSTTQLRRTYPIDLYVGSSTGGQPQLANADLVNSVRSTHPLHFLQVAQRFFPPGSTGSTSISVGLQDYEFGVLYHMKLDGEGEAGNFGPVTFEGGGGDAFRDDLRDGYDGVIRIGQIVETEPGVQTGPTRQALEYRMEGPSWDEWLAMGMPRDSRRLVYVPVIERIERVTGRSKFVVVSFAAFYLENTEGASDIWGRFVEYVTPTDFYEEQPPDTGMYLETYRLVPPQTGL